MAQIIDIRCAAKDSVLTANAVPVRKGVDIGTALRHSLYYIYMIVFRVLSAGLGEI